MNQRKGVIYEIIFPNGKRYIGQTKCLKTRLSVYRRLRCQTQPKLYNAILKYGWQNVCVSVIYECDSIDETNLLEQISIRQYRTIEDDFGYNIESGGKNHERSEETKRKIGLSNKNRKSAEDIRKLILRNKSRAGSKASDETRRKMSAASKNRKISPESEKKRVASFMEGYASGRSKTRKGIANHCLRDKTIYAFKHADGRSFLGLRRDFQLTYNLSVAAVNYILKHKKYDKKGWFLIK